MFTCIHINTCVYIYIYTLSASRKPSGRFLWFPSSTSSNVFYGFRRRHHPTFLYGFRRWFPMVSVVAGNVLFMVSVVGFLMVSVVAGKRCLMVSVLPAASKIIFGSSQIRDCAGDTRARSDSDIAMRSPAAKDPDLTSGLRGFIPGRVRFQGNYVCLFVLACCLLLFVFVCFLLPSRAGRQSREAEPRSSATCLVSATFPLRFCCVSVARLPAASAQGQV